MSETPRPLWELKENMRTALRQEFYSFTQADRALDAIWPLIKNHLKATSKRKSIGILGVPKEPAQKDSSSQAK